MTRLEPLVYFVSDHTGVTAAVLGRSLLARFEGLRPRTRTRPFVDTPEKARELVAEIDAEGGEAVVVSTITDAAVRSELDRSRALVLDLFEPYLERLAGRLGLEPRGRVGAYHGIVDLGRYQARIDALEFALGTDDGLGTRHYDRAELVLVGVSRAGKTPTCLYLAMQHGVRAANYPLAEDDFASTALPAALRPHRPRLRGLTIDPLRLHQIRRARRDSQAYASLERCQHEVAAAERLFARNAIPVLDATALSIEELAAKLLLGTER